MFWDSSSIVHKKKKLNEIIEESSIAKYEDGQIDPNTTLYDLILTCHSNAPIEVTGEFYYIRTMFYYNKSITSNRAQIAYGYRRNRIAYRYYINGNWSEWGIH